MLCLDKLSYSKFLESHVSSDFILECIQSDDKTHPCIDELCMVLVYILKSKTTYIINLTHPDCTSFIDKQTLIGDFNKLKGKKWVFDKKKCLHLFPIHNLFDINIIFFISTFVYMSFSVRICNTMVSYKNKNKGEYVLDDEAINR